MGSRGTSEDRETKFSGYGNHLASGVEIAPNRWKGGELVTDPTLITKSLKPRTMFYSPIGHGVVAADGIELKRGPVDLTPKVEIIQQRIVEKGQAGQAGLNVTERTWTTGGGGSEIQTTNQASVTGAAPPKSVADLLGSGVGQPTATTAKSASAAPAAPLNTASPFAGLSDSLGPAPPATNVPLTKPLTDFATASAPASNYNSLGSRTGTDPYATLASLRSGPGPYDSLPKSDTNGYKDDYPASGRTSTTSALWEPGYRYEIEKYYRVTNPKELIHQYATTTPVQTIPGYESLVDGGMTTKMTKQSYSSSTEETFTPYAPYHGGPHSVHPNNFVRQLRDDNLTISQRQANQNLQPLNVKDSSYDQRIEQIRRQTQSVSPNPDVDNLTSRMMTNLHTRKY